MNSRNVSVCSRSVFCVVLCWLPASFLGVAVAAANPFAGYSLTDSLDLPPGTSVFAPLSDGRIIALLGDTILIETAPASGDFQTRGALPDADIAPFGAAFLQVSPSGDRFAVGNNGGATFANYQIGVFNVSTLDGEWYAANHFSAAWVDDTHLAVTAGDFTTGQVTLLDFGSPNPQAPLNPIIIANIGGASGGVALDAFGNLYTGNGFKTVGPSATGAVKTFGLTAWQGALQTGIPLDFETQGTLVVDILSATSLGFDDSGNLHVAGGDFDAFKVDFAALVHADVVTAALAGNGPADINDPTQVRRLDPDASDDFNFYTIGFDPAMRRLMLRSFGSDTVYSYTDPNTAVPTTSFWGLVVLAIALLILGTVQSASRYRDRCAVQLMAGRR